MLDRKIQLQILETLASSYPKQISPARTLAPTHGDKETVFNLAYLDEHELTKSTWSYPINGDPIPVSTKITAKGIDFISDDGGLSSILGVVTIKLHQDTITALFIERIEKSSAPTSVKQQLISKLKGLPAEALQKISLKAIETGLEKIDVANWFDSFFS